MNAKTPSISEKLIKRFFKNEIKEGEIDPDLYLEVAKNLKETLDKSIGLNFKYNEPDNILRAKLQTNLFAFSGAKSFSMFEQIRNELTNKDGSVRTFAEFKEQVLAIDLNYNVNWLKTEYNQALVQSQHAKNWQRFEVDKDLFPNLRYVTAGDDRVRSDHRALDGIIRPVDDSFWDTYAPQNGWGCRCVLEQEDEDSILTNPDTAHDLGKGAVKQKIFKTNVGKTGIIFEKDHPYFVNLKGVKSQLKAVENYGMRTTVDIYNKPAKLSSYQGGLKSEEDYKTWWENKVKTDKHKIANSFVLESSIGHQVLFDQKLYRKLKTSTDKEYLFADELPKVMSAPDEVWTQSSPKSFKTIYIKYYKDSALILITSPVTKTKEIKVVNYNKFTSTDDIEGYRLGVLEYRK